MTTTTRTISPEERLANVQAALVECYRRLRSHGKTINDARALLARRGLFARTNKGTARRVAVVWLWDAAAAVNALENWLKVREEYRRGELVEIVDDGTPF